MPKIRIKYSQPYSKRDFEKGLEESGQNRGAMPDSSAWSLGSTQKAGLELGSGDEGATSAEMEKSRGTTKQAFTLGYWSLSETEEKGTENLADQKSILSHGNSSTAEGEGTEGVTLQVSTSGLGCAAKTKEKETDMGADFKQGEYVEEGNMGGDGGEYEDQMDISGFGTCLDFEIVPQQEVPSGAVPLRAVFGPSDMVIRHKTTHTGLCVQEKSII